HDKKSLGTASFIWQHVRACGCEGEREVQIQTKCSKRMHQPNVSPSPHLMLLSLPPSSHKPRHASYFEGGFNKSKEMCRNLGDDIHYASPIIPLTRKTNEVDVVYFKGGENIIFSQTKGDGDEVSTALTHSIASETLYGGISQHQRERTLNHFGRGKLTKHVATDVAFRGLDIQNVDL
ncbi:unnamed protein product, partial [Dovyalis caffra]